MVSPTVSVKIPTGEVLKVKPGATRAVFERLAQDAEPESTPVALYVNGALQSAQEPFQCDCEVSGVPLNTAYGQDVVRRSLVHLFMAAVTKLDTGLHFTLRYTIGRSWFFRATHTQVPPELVERIEPEMRRLVEADEEFEIHQLRYQAALDMFESRGDKATASQLRLRTEPTVRVVTMGGFTDLYVGPVVPSTRLLSVFKLHACHGGIALCYANHRTPLDVEEFVDEEEHVKVHAEHHAWAMHLGLDSVGQLNAKVAQGDRSLRELIQLCDLNQERYIGAVADKVPQSARLVLIAGPSSSGKTTFSRKLSVHLKCRGFDPVYLSCDDFFVNREDTPRLPDGSYDFEAVEAVDHAYLNDFLNRLIAGEEVPLPSFNFKIGRREFHGRTLMLPPSGLIVFEGIHCLNPVLTDLVPEDEKFRVFISPVTSMAVSDRHRLSTSDNRLVRRIVRDFKYRGFSAASTLAMWESVRAGEDKHIYRFQREADAVMNSALNYELAVLGKQAIPLLRSIPPSDPTYPDARRLLALLDQFLPIDEDMVPSTSILQEFLGISYLFG